MTVTPGGVLMMIVGILIIVGALLALAFTGSHNFLQYAVLVFIGVLGGCVVMGGSEIKK